MRISEAIFSSLHDWGQHPAFLDLRPNKPAVATSAEQFTGRIREITRLLRSMGIKPGYLVSLFLENSTDFPCIFLALIHLGAVPVLSKLEYRKLELDEVFSNARPQAVIAEGYHLPVLAPYLKDRLLISRGTEGLKLVQTPLKSLKESEIDEEIASINYTYRGYGYPLGAMISHDQYLHGARALQDALQARAGDKMLVILPMVHIFTLIGCIFVPLFYRMTAVIARTIHPRHIFNFIKDYHIDHITSVPEIFEMLYKFKDAAAGLSSLKVFVSGGSMLTADRFRRLKKAFGIDLLHGYGLTEFTPASGNIRGQARAGTIGPLCDGLDCRIAAPDANGAGEILLKAPSMCRGYYRRPRETNDVVADGWFKTGDIGRLENGHLIFVREKKNTRKLNGNIVDLEEVRRAIQQVENVEMIKIERCNNALKATVAVKTKADFTEETKKLRQSLKGMIATYKIPSFTRN